MRRRGQSGQVIVLVAFALLALIGSAALVLVAGSVEWQKNQLQQLADQAALDAAMKIGIGCSATSASAVITEADDFVASQRARTGSLSVAAGTCATPYTGTDT
ncbi:MAG: pilus assembly protein TadG-related protein, partial [Candidatus Limnocylindria bacterium]